MDKVGEMIRNWFDVWKFIVVLVGFVVVLWADDRYMTKEEAASMTNNFNAELSSGEQRSKDWYDKHEEKIRTNTSALSKIDSRLSRIEAQNDLMLKYLEAGGAQR